MDNHRNQRGRNYGGSNQDWNNRRYDRDWNDRGHGSDENRNSGYSDSNSRYGSNEGYYGGGNFEHSDYGPNRYNRERGNRYSNQDHNYGYGGREYGSSYGGGTYRGNSSYYGGGSYGRGGTSYGENRNLYDRDYEGYNRGGNRDWRTNRLGAGNYGDYNERSGYNPNRNYDDSYSNRESWRSPYGEGHPEERSWWDRTKDEVSSWFGDDDAERRRERDRMMNYRGKGPRNYVRSDDRIKEDVNDRLSDDPFVDASDIEVSVNAGEVTLTGTVSERSDKRRAEDIAEAVSGVKNVENRIRVAQYSESSASNIGTGTSIGTGSGYGTGVTGMGTSGERSGKGNLVTSD